METSATDWLRTGISALGSPRRMRALAGDARYRVEQKYARRFSDVQLRQLRSLERAYSGAAGPDVLVCGDSIMFWTTPNDTDHRHAVEMIRDEIGPQTTVEALVGPLYNARLVLTYLTALRQARSLPKVIIVPASVMMSQTVWLASPDRGYELISAELREIIAAGPAARRPRHLTSPENEEAVLAWERLPAPSLFGARRTVGELRLITNTPPATRWQTVIRLRHLLDYCYAERLTPDSLGVRLLAELGDELRDLGVPAIAYVPPSNCETMVTAFGPGAAEHMTHNAALLERTFLEHGGPIGTVVNANADHPASEFIDPTHLGPAGRLKLARRIAAVAAPYVNGHDRGTLAAQETA